MPHVGDVFFFFFFFSPSLRHRFFARPAAKSRGIMITATRAHNHPNAFFLGCDYDESSRRDRSSRLIIHSITRKQSRMQF